MPAAIVRHVRWNSVNFTGKTNLKFRLKYTEKISAYNVTLRITVDTTQIYTHTWGHGDDFDWTQITVDLTPYSLTGTHYVLFSFSESYGSESNHDFWLDNVELTTNSVAAFTYTPAYGNLPFTVAFTDGSTGATTYDWDFGDGSAHSTVQNPSHIYTTAGTHTVTLSINSGETSISHDVVIGDPVQTQGATTAEYKGTNQFFMDGVTFQTIVQVAGSVAQYFGISDNAFPGDTSSHGVYFFYNSSSNTFTLNTRNGTSVTSISLTEAITPSVDQTFRIQIYGGKATFFLNGVQKAVIDTNIPTTELGGIVHYRSLGTSSTTSAATAKSMKVTYYGDGTIISRSVNKRISDLMWNAQIELVGFPILNSPDISIRMRDHTDTDNLLFVGYIPSPTFSEGPARNKTTLSAFSNAWFLTKQYLTPPDWANYGIGTQQSMLYNPDDPDNEHYTGDTITDPAPDIYLDTSIYPGMTTYIDIQKFITFILGGTSLWNSLSGIRPHDIQQVDDWDGTTIPFTDFGFGDKTTSMDAVQAFLKKFNFLFSEVFGVTGSVDEDWGVFCPDDADDTTLHLPAKVTFTSPDPYVVGDIFGEDKSGEMFNRVRVRGSRSYVQENHTATTTPDAFTLGQYGAELSVAGTKVSGVLVGGNWVYSVYPVDIADLVEHLTVNNEVDYVTISNLQVADGTHSADIVTLTYSPFALYYENTISVAGVYPTGTIRPIEAPPIVITDGSLSTQALVDALSSDYFALCRINPNIYHAILLRRCDLRLGQLVKFVGYTKIPEDDMRITAITYTSGKGGVVVQIECVLDGRLRLQRLFNDFSSMNDVDLIRRVANKEFSKQFPIVEPSTCVADDGTVIIGIKDSGLYNKTLER